jgi:Zn-dependent protease
MIKNKIKGIRVNRAIMLQMAVKAINNIAGYNSIVLTLLVFRAFSQITHINPSAILIAQRATAIKKAIAEIIKLRTQKQVINTLQT